MSTPISGHLVIGAPLYRVGYVLMITHTHAPSTPLHTHTTLTVLFNDTEIAGEILKTTNPKEQKEFGRKVSNFNKDVWNSKCKEFVRKGNLAKVFEIELCMTLYGSITCKGYTVTLVAIYALAQLVNKNRCLLAHTLHA